MTHRRVVLLLSATTIVLALALGSAHEQRPTMVAASKGKEFGIETYRVRQIGNGLQPSPTDPKQPTTTQTFAELLNAGGQQMGTFHMTMHWRRERDGKLKVNKYYLRAKSFELTWLNESFKADMAGENLTLAYNGVEVYSGHITAMPTEQAKAFREAHLLLLQIGGAVEADLNKHYQPPARDIQCCGMEAGNIVCTGTAHWVEAYALQLSEACEKAERSAHMSCWNNYCTGCCSISSCNGMCSPFGDFFCIGKVKGTSCRCSTFVY